jgi:hypothetical protein
VHHVFHFEHNRLVAQTKDTMLASGDLAFLNEWLLDDVAAMPTTPPARRLVYWRAAVPGRQVRHLMQYQHLVFEEFARTIQPQVDLFPPPGGYDTSINPDPRRVRPRGVPLRPLDADRNRRPLRPSTSTQCRRPANPDQQLGLIAAFLNPLAFAGSGATADEAAPARSFAA